VPLTFDLTEEQIAHIRKLLLRDVSELQRIARSDAFARYGEMEAAQIHEDIRIGSALIGYLPMPRKVA
jgi:hypothetical protein